MTTLTLSRPYPPVREEVEHALKARRTLLGYTRWTAPWYAAARHHALTAEKLEAVERGDITRLLIEEPPQHGKSELASKRFPAWAMCRRPTRRIITASYGDVLANEFGRKSRNIVASD